MQHTWKLAIVLSDRDREERVWVRMAGVSRSFHGIDMACIYIPLKCSEHFPFDSPANLLISTKRSRPASCPTSQFSCITLQQPPPHQRPI